VNMKFNVFYSTFTNVFMLVKFLFLSRLTFLTFFYFNLNVFFTSVT